MERAARGVRVACRLALAAFLALGLVPRAGHAQKVAGENDLKVAYVYNFIVLSAWPPGEGTVVRICLAGGTETKVFGVLAGKTVRDRTLTVTTVATPAQAVDCSVLYVGPGEATRLAAWLAPVANRPILTISDQSELPGAIVNLRLAGQQIVFDLDTGAAAAARIQLSSQLIKLAARRK